MPSARAGRASHGARSGLRHTATIAIAERCEQATGPDRELDADIDRAVFPNEWVNEFFDPTRHDLPTYTASLDAAMTLVPEGFKLKTWDRYERRAPAQQFACAIANDFGSVCCNGAASYATALCAAALKARAAEPVTAAEPPLCQWCSRDAREAHAEDCPTNDAEQVSA